MKFLGSLWLVAGAVAGALASPTDDTLAAANHTEGAEDTYEYIVIGSGAGGGPLAARLARANHSVLLIEAGDDRGTDYNYTVPGFQAAVTEDKNIAWNIFVNHYPNETQAKRDPKYVYATPDGGEYVGLDPPSGSTPKGVLYPRAGTLGGCVSHNALIWILPQAIDWNTIWQITDDQGWSQNEMLQHLGSVTEWLSTEATDPTIVLRDFQLIQHFAGAAATMGIGPDPINAITGLAQLLLANPNFGLNRDEGEGFFQVPLIMKNGARDGVRERIVDTIKQGYPLTLRTNSFVTKINFDESGDTPVATGVEYEDGQWLYQASPLNTGAKGTPGSAKATKEVIVAGGTYNTAQLLKLSGIGPQAELQQHGIKVVKNLPGVGKNLQDRYEVPVNVIHPNDFPILNGCTFDAKEHDECYKQWVNNPSILAGKGAYATNGLAATMAVNSEYADDKNIDLYIFGGPVNFTGYFPGWAQKAIESHKYFSWYTLKAHTRNTAGTVELRSTNPFEQPEVNFNYFEYGTTENDADLKDLNSLVQAINISRHALSEYNTYPILGGTKFTEVSPGPHIQSTADLQQYVKDVAWGHHACCTAKIGAGNDPDTVLDSKFRVQGVKGLRVVDASIFPKIPGIFIQAPILIASEKAAYDILKGN